MEFDQKEETPFNLPVKKETDKKTLAIYIAAGVISISSLIFGYASYQATYFKDAEIQKLKSDLEEANFRLQRIDVLENQVKELEAEYISNKENIGSAEEEVDFLKRNYDTADKIKTLAKIGFGDIYNSLANKLPLMVDDLDNKNISNLQKLIFENTVCQILNAQMNVVKVLTFKY